jgi:predicted urease superfamily metal-dependent hydrolase
MTGPVQVVLGALDAASRPLAQADTELQACGQTLVAAVEAATAAAVQGELADALGDLGTEPRDRARERGAECRELAQALADAAEDYRAADAGGAVSFGGVTG